MKPLRYIGIAFKEGTHGWSDNTDARNIGTVVSLPLSMEVNNVINDPLADLDDPRTVIDKQGNTISTAFYNLDIRVGDTVCTTWSNILSLEESGRLIDGVAYIGADEIIWVERDGDIRMCHGVLVSRMAYEEAGELDISVASDGYMPSVGRVSYTSAIYGLDISKGDIVFHFGARGQSHMMPDGNGYELIHPYMLIGKLKGGAQ